MKELYDYNNILADKLLAEGNIQNLPDREKTGIINVIDNYKHII